MGGVALGEVSVNAFMGRQGPPAAQKGRVAPNLRRASPANAHNNQATDGSRFFGFVEMLAAKSPEEAQRMLILAMQESATLRQNPIGCFGRPLVAPATAAFGTAAVRGRSLARRRPTATCTGQRPPETSRAAARPTTPCSSVAAS